MDLELKNIAMRRNKNINIFTIQLVKVYRQISEHFHVIFKECSLSPKKNVLLRLEKNVLSNLSKN